jgi:GNAT superfamily N-acetyltransferase
MAKTDTITIRVGPRPGDLGTVLAMHGELYAREFGYDERFEAHVAGGLTTYADALGAARDTGTPGPGRLWLAEDGDTTIGTIALMDAGERTPQIRWFLVDPDTRGTGVGRRLLDLALDHAEDGGARHVLLWTVDGLAAAQHLYTSVGFRCTERVPGRRFGRQLVELRYDLDLADRVRGSS